MKNIKSLAICHCGLPSCKKTVP